MARVAPMVIYVGSQDVSLPTIPPAPSPIGSRQNTNLFYAARRFP